MRIHKIRKEQLVREKTKSMEIDDFGEVLARGWGEKPDEATIARMIEGHGYRPA